MSFFRDLFGTRQGRLTLFLGFGAMLNFGDRSALAAVLPPLREELKISDSTLGIVMSLFLITYAVCSPFAGMLADRFSRAFLVIASLMIWSLFMGLSGFSAGLIMLCISRIGLGMSESPFPPAAFALAADHHTPVVRARAMSIISLGNQLGTFVGGASAGYLALWLGWRSAFWILGGLGVCLALVGRFFVFDAPQTAAAPKARASQALLYLLRDRSFYLVAGKLLLAEPGTWIFYFWLPLYLFEKFHLNLGQAGFAGTFALSISTVIGVIVGGWISDTVAKREGKYRMAMWGTFYLVGAPFLLIFYFKPGFGAVMAAVAAFSIFRGAAAASERPTVCEVVPPQYRATTFGIVNAFACSAGALGALLAGLLKKTVGLEAVFASSAVLYILAGAALFIGAFVWMPRDMVRARALEAKIDRARPDDIHENLCSMKT